MQRREHYKAKTVHNCGKRLSLHPILIPTPHPSTHHNVTPHPAGKDSVPKYSPGEYQEIHELLLPSVISMPPTHTHTSSDSAPNFPGLQCMLTLSYSILTWEKHIFSSMVSEADSHCISPPEASPEAKWWKEVKEMLSDFHVIASCLAQVKGMP